VAIFRQSLGLRPCHGCGTRLRCVARLAKALEVRGVAAQPALVVEVTLAYARVRAAERQGRSADEQPMERNGLQSVVSMLAVVVVALLAGFLGFSECGSYRWVNNTVMSAIVVVTILAVVIRTWILPTSAIPRRLRSQISFVMIVVVTFVVGHKGGEFLYSPPVSLGDWFSLGGC
jgi:hypothetical protein